ncbi:MAG: hypothetical protein J6T37_08920 [Bacteroidales bacterium]|jgi:hypothetical protein|nr:hypothetical protein [Bacteroidales bacterium]MBQ3844198.1 hypothetical protein [Bacteroidales bacterium]
MKRFLLSFFAFTVLISFSLTGNALTAENDTISIENQKVTKSKLTVGGYGEAVYTRHFYSDNMFRYSHPDRYKNARGHGRIDLPHVVINIGYDFGNGWTMGSEIEFEHGGNEVAVEMEPEETGEFEHEIERGGEVALEQFWIQKSFSKVLNIRMGHIIVPVGQTNSAHLPTQFFTCYRPEGELTILPCTWHETGISVWGKIGKWRYEALVVPALNSNMFDNANWVKNGSASAYEFRVANNLAYALRIDNYSVKNLHIGVSGYIGNTFNNDIVTNESDKYKNVKGTLLIGTAEFDYNCKYLIIRGNLDYGHLNDADIISAYNKNQNHQSFSPYPRSLVGEEAVAIGGEIAYDIFNLMKNMDDRRLFIFGRYDYYDSYIPYEGALTDYQWTERHVMTLGLNYYPIKQVVIKAEYAQRFLKEQYNTEPMLSLGVAYSGFFIK